MNILSINTYAIGGGAAKIAHLLHTSFQNRNIQSIMLVGYLDKKNTDENIIALEPSFISADTQFSINNISSMILSNDIDHLLFPVFKRYKDIEHADIIHCHNLHGNFFNLHTLKTLSSKKPIVWTLQDMWSITGHCAYSLDCDGWRKGCYRCPYLSLYQKLYFDRSHSLWKKKRDIYNNIQISLVTPSLWLKNLVQKSILQDKPVTVIHNGINTSIFRQSNKKLCREKLGLPMDKKIILFVASGGTRNIWKGWKYVVDIMNALQDEHIVFVSIGNKNSDEKSSRYIQRNDTRNQQSLSEYYSAADVLVFPSIADNCPLVILESMSCGLPVVAVRIGGIPEIIDHKKNGYLATYGDVSDLLYGIRYILQQDPLQIKHLQSNAIKKIKAQFSLNSMVNQYISLYKTLL